jgi:hypothetical protein
VNTKLARLNAYGRYAIDKVSGIRIDYIYDRYSTNDWTWTNFTYVDGTTLSENQKQTMNLVAASYYFKF